MCDSDRIARYIALLKLNEIIKVLFQAYLADKYTHTHQANEMLETNFRWVKQKRATGRVEKEMMINLIGQFIHGWFIYSFQCIICSSKRFVVKYTRSLAHSDTLRIGRVRASFNFFFLFSMLFKV